MKLKIIFWVAACSFTSSAWAKFIENTDITSYVNQLLKHQKVVSIPAGTYKIDANKSITPKDGTEIRLTPQTKLAIIPTKHGSYRVFQVKNVKNVKISGGSLTGDKYTHLGKTGEWGMGIEIRDSQNISISNMNIDKMWGDAIYIGTNGKNSTYNISLKNIRMNDNRRQGISIISVNKLLASNITATNTSGAMPASGIDIEPNNGSMILKNIVLKNIKTSGNQGSGIQIGLSRYDNSTKPLSITIENHQDANSGHGLLLGAINKKAIGTMSIQSNSSGNCFNAWSNNSIKVDIVGATNISNSKGCNGHLRNSSISLK
ncbi:TPA: right-handed parallel beta-helix repeat-containing protein [Acinetobacter baumannii]|uniref:right-handed parallel beta-helix repeat-containing protein n=1 Tax=Acinetobacter baumannii TaxID=470 RepID=UPI000F2AA7FA|nr:right-handed parallel beta-helix repeat-containing protein [Acinetobacter baumannii]EJD6467845.1 right-handed parallel beta-helix repeat-containing protein [Acinetobacter baumannii]MBW4059235.1 right-handed parallel beta-helix repeat-containing protein [Acinetobacter baumannii]MBW4063206.1 right-handed parallel beta-helix repeat-containing protein [Acinetobacter baumannii]MBW4066713.1 right-handed parallel beta-helix repeat-containing protein [Acinetobacter baumannii]MBW4073134.1 right-hand